ncbi:hypothetical protein FWC31_01855 [Candidatus Saccharibacteria bacterium]|nr:hypothetical protein [Candidatus Saccharibacteria bacterium]
MNNKNDRNNTGEKSSTSIGKRISKAVLAVILASSIALPGNAYANATNESGITVDENGNPVKIDPVSVDEDGNMTNANGDGTKTIAKPDGPNQYNVTNNGETQPVTTVSKDGLPESPEEPPELPQLGSPQGGAETKNVVTPTDRTIRAFKLGTLAIVSLLFALQKRGERKRQSIGEQLR